MFEGASRAALTAHARRCAEVHAASCGERRPLVQAQRADPACELAQRANWYRRSVVRCRKQVQQLEASGRTEKRRQLEQHAAERGREESRLARENERARVAEQRKADINMKRELTLQAHMKQVCPCCSVGCCKPGASLLSAAVFGLNATYLLDLVDIRTKAATPVFLLAWSSKHNSLGNRSSAKPACGTGQALMRSEDCARQVAAQVRSDRHNAAAALAAGMPKRCNREVVCGVPLPLFCLAIGTRQRSRCGTGNVWQAVNIGK